MHFSGDFLGFLFSQEHLFSRNSIRKSLGCSRARDTLGSFRPSPEKTTCSFPYRFSGKSRNSGLVPGKRDPNSCKHNPEHHKVSHASFRVVADIWEKDVWDFQAKSGSSGSCRLFLHFLEKSQLKSVWENAWKSQTPFFQTSAKSFIP